MWKPIFTTTIIAGTLDILAACTNAYLSAKTTPDIVLKYIACGVFGNSAFAGGVGMMFFGLLFHFIIAFSCTFIFFWLYPKLPFLKQNMMFNAVLIGIIAWIVTNKIIIPLSQIPSSPFNFYQALVAVFILIVCIGVPIAYSAKRFFNPIIA
jgi:uncharacterized membrane protein YagU involved in acid resistance